MKFLNIIENLKLLSTEKDIQENLASLKDNATWLRILKMTYDPSLNYWVKNVDMSLFKNTNDISKWSLEFCLDELEKLSRREITGDAAYYHVIKIMEHSEEPELINLILQRTFRMGIEAKTFNKAYGSNFIPETPYMRCGLLSEKTLKNINYPCYSQVKMDGQYIAMVVTSDGIKTVSRQGKDYDFLGHFDVDAIMLRDAYMEDIVLTGEMLVVDENGISNRQTGNGIIQKFGKGTGTHEEVKNLKFVVWDVIPYSSYINGKDNSEYDKRFNKLIFALNKTASKHIKPIEFVICNNQEEVYEHYFECVGKGEEGTIVKDYKLDWKNGTSTKQLKVKVEFEVDLRVIGFNQGNVGTWNQDILGSVIFQSECGILEVSAGQWKEKDRYEIWENKEKYIDQVGTLVAHRITQDKKTGKPSLYLPRFKQWRLGDKVSCDTFERIKEIEESTLLIKKHKRD